MGDSKLDKVIIQPSKITDLPIPRPDGLASGFREYSLQFQAPPQANLYSFVLHAASDTFLGADVSQPMMVSPAGLAVWGWIGCMELMIVESGGTARRRGVRF